MERLASVPRLVESMLTGERRALARLFSLVERDTGAPAAISEAVHPHAGRAYYLGVTGPPGAGKSTIVDQIVGILRYDGASVGVLAVDPSSPRTGGAVLGDRIRMRRHYLDKGVFIRSVATRGAHGGISQTTGTLVKLMDAFGYDVVVVETAGVGQTELDIMKLADTVLVVYVPEAGDAVQAMKAGLMEIADVFAVNKADREGAGRLAAAIEAELGLGGPDTSWRPPVLLTQAHRGEGVGALWDAILEHRKTMQKTSELERRRRERRKRQFADRLRETLQAGVERVVFESEAVSALTACVESGQVDPYAAAAQALGDRALLSELARAVRAGDRTGQSAAEGDR